MEQPLSRGPSRCRGERETGMLETGQPGFGVRVRVEGSLPGGPALACAGRGGSLDRKPEPVTVNAQ